MSFVHIRFVNSEQTGSSCAIKRTTSTITVMKVGYFKEEGVNLDGRSLSRWTITNQRAILSFKIFFFPMSIPQSVHIGNMTAEAENGNVRKNGKEWRHRVHSTQKKSQQVDGSKKRAEQDSRACAKSTGWTCGVCLQWFPERDSYVSHVKMAHTKVRGHEFLMPERGCSVKPVFLCGLSSNARSREGEAFMTIVILLFNSW